MGEGEDQTAPKKIKPTFLQKRALQQEGREKEKFIPKRKSLSHAESYLPPCTPRRGRKREAKEPLASESSDISEGMETNSRRTASQSGRRSDLPPASLPLEDFLFEVSSTGEAPPESYPPPNTLRRGRKRPSGSCAAKGAKFSKGQDEKEEHLTPPSALLEGEGVCPQSGTETPATPAAVDTPIPESMLASKEVVLFLK
ncbi:MAG: hypothetical protein GY721_02425 [Deltaproteobacteria bacterium]|nr:hypothetical protein [Deltaproteobacteria bacterium]